MSDDNKIHAVIGAIRNRYRYLKDLEGKAPLHVLCHLYPPNP